MSVVDLSATKVAIAAYRTLLDPFLDTTIKNSRTTADVRMWTAAVTLCAAGVVATYLRDTRTMNSLSPLFCMSVNEVEKMVLAIEVSMSKGIRPSAASHA